MNFLYKTKPYEKQAEAFYKAYDKEFFALFLEQGCGKTKVAIDICSNLFNEGKIDAVLLIAPNGVNDQWPEELDIHSPVIYTSFLFESKNTKSYSKAQSYFINHKTNKLKWFCVNVENFSSNTNIEMFKAYCLNHKTMVIIDEATRIKTPTSKRFFNIAYNLNEFVKFRKAIKSVAYTSKYRLILTGTMVTNSPYDIWAMFEFLKFNYFQMNYFGFKARYGMEVNAITRGAGGREINYSRAMQPIEIKQVKAYLDSGFDVYETANKLRTDIRNVMFIKENPGNQIPYKNLDELKAKIEPFSFITTKKECLDLPPKIYEKIHITMSKEQSKAYNELKDSLITVLSSKELSVPNKLVLLGRLQQITGGFFPYTQDLDNPYDMNRDPIMIGNKNPKIEALKLDLEETGDQQIIVWSRFVAEIKAIHRELEKAYPDKVVKMYYGGVSKPDKQKIIADFKNGLVDILVSNQASAGIGLNLQNCSHQYYFSNSFSLEQREQSEDRIHRGGQTNPCLYKDLIVKDTVDEHIYKALKSKKQLLEYFRNNEVIKYI